MAFSPRGPLLPDRAIIACCTKNAVVLTALLALIANEAVEGIPGGYNLVIILLHLW